MPSGFEREPVIIKSGQVKNVSALDQSIMNKAYRRSVIIGVHEISVMANTASIIIHPVEKLYRNAKIDLITN